MKPKRNLSRWKRTIGILALGGALVCIWFTSVRGVVYICDNSSANCGLGSQAGAGRTVYLLAGDKYSSHSNILQTTTTGVGGYFLFIGAPSYSYTVAVVVGEFESGSVYGSSVNHPQLRYCVFTTRPDNFRFHRIDLHSPEYTQAFINEWGGGPEGGPLPCPE